MFRQNFMNLCNKEGISPSRVAAELGLAKSAVSAWKKGAIPHDRTLYRIAEYFGVTVDELTRDEESPSSEAGGVPVESLTADEPPTTPTMAAFPVATPPPAPAPFAAGESELLDYYRNFTREGQGRLLDFAEAMKRSGMYEPGVDYFMKGLNSEAY